MTLYPKICIVLSALIAPTPILSFSGTPISKRNDMHVDCLNAKEEGNPETISRTKFLSVACTSLPLLGQLVTAYPQPASARGFATLQNAYDRYSPRIIAGGEFYSKGLKSIIAKSDWVALKAATSDPPKKTKADRSKIDGGIAERAEQAGNFSDAKVLVAADLYASTFSDNSITEKTKTMREKVEKLRVIVMKLNFIAKEALGEAKESGGLFGLGNKQSTPADLSKTAKQLYVEGGNLWNEYIFAANEGIPNKLNPLPFI